MTVWGLWCSDCAVECAFIQEILSQAILKLVVENKAIMLTRYVSYFKIKKDLIHDRPSFHHLWNSPDPCWQQG